MKKWLHDNGLSVTMFFFFVVFLAGMSLAGWHEYLETHAILRRPALSFPAYLLSGHFLEALMENLESEFLQMGMYIALTAVLFQRGSAESNDPDGCDGIVSSPVRESGEVRRGEMRRGEAQSEVRGERRGEVPWPVRRGGWVLALYSHSLSLAFLLLFILTFSAHVVTGLSAYNDQQAIYGLPPVQLSEYFFSSSFWFESLQNWQSEFLAIGLMAVLSIWLREKDSPESKAVDDPHCKTGAA